MSLDTSRAALNAQIDALRSDFASYSANVLERNRAYLRTYSPPFNSKLGEHDQWAKPPTPKDAGHTRSSYNITRAVVELWSALEASEYPSIRWQDDFRPVPAPDMDEAINAQRRQTYKAAKLVAQHVSTMREEVVRRQIRAAKLKIHHYRATRRKNVYGHAWLKLVPDRRRRRFTALSKIDPSTVFPVWSSWDDRKLDAVLVAYRKSARTLARSYPDVVKLDETGSAAISEGHYYPSAEPASDLDLRFVWVEDYWVLDEDYEQEVEDDAEPITSRVVNVIRVNGKIVQQVEYPGWKAIPYFLYVNEDERDNLGFSDVGGVQPIQDGINRFVSQQQDVIHGESRPKFKFRSDGGTLPELNDEEVVQLEPDEDIEQIAVRLDVFPTQVHGQQLMELLARETGLNDSVWGRIVASQNSGRALATAWRSVAARMIPRIFSANESITDQITFMVDIMELYDWNSAKALYRGNRDFEPDFPNQEPRDFLEVTNDAINKLNAGIVDQVKAMELTGEESPDEMVERVRADYMDTVLHPEKGQAYLLLQRLRQQIEIEAQQAGISMQAAMAQLAASPAGGAPAGGSVEQQAAAANQAQTQAAQQSAPRLTEGQNAPATQAGAAANPSRSTKVSTLVQDGRAMNRIIDQGTVA